MGNAHVVLGVPDKIGVMALNQPESRGKHWCTSIPFLRIAWVLSVQAEAGRLIFLRSVLRPDEQLDSKWTWNIVESFPRHYH